MINRIALHLGLIAGALALGLSVLAPPAFAGAQGAEGYVKQIIGFNTDRTPVTRGIPGIWVKWTDHMGNYRFALSDNDGYFRFFSWQNTRYINNSNWLSGVREEYCDENDLDCSGDVGQGYWRQTQCTSAIAAPVSSFYTVRSGGACDGNGFGCGENPHVFTIVNTPTGANGSPLTGCVTSITVPEIVNTTLIPRPIGEFRYTSTTCAYLEPSAIPTPTPTSTATPIPTPTPIPGQPTLGALVIKNDTATSAIVGPTYGVSRSRDLEGGSNVYNAIKVTQYVDSNENQTALVGIAFTPHRDIPGNSLLDLTSAITQDNNNGFILIRANNFSGTKTAANQTFEPNKYYVFGPAGWREISATPIGTSLRFPEGCNENPPQPITCDFSVRVADEDSFLPPLKAPTFSVTFYQNLGYRSWATYGYYMTTNNIQSFVRKPACNSNTPGAACTPQ